MRRLLLLLVSWTPKPFRRQFGDAMAEQVERDLALARARGPLAAAFFFAATVLDLLRCAALEHLSPSWQGAPSPRGRPTHRTGDSRTMLDAWTNDFRLAVRALLRSPAFTAATVATLGLAIGVNAGIFAVVDRVLLDPLPYRDTDRLVVIQASAPGTDMPEEFGLSREFLVHYGDRSELIEDISFAVSFTSTLRTEDRTERIRMSSPSPSLFRLLGEEPIMGRTFADDDPEDVVVISHALWTSWFGSDPHILGRRYHVSGADRTVIGVMGEDFWFPNDGTVLWYPQRFELEDITPGRFGQPVVARMAPGVSREQLAAELDQLAAQLPDRFGGSSSYADVIRRHRAVVRPLEEQLIGPFARPIWILFGAVAVVLLIACANVANLFTVRAERRLKDLALQRALGATRAQLVRAQMAEALLLALAGGTVAVAFALATVPLLVRVAPDRVPRIGEVAVGWETLAFTAAAALFAAILCGLGPALRGSAARYASLREESRTSTGRRHWARNGLVVVQTALALVLLIGSALLLRSFTELRRVDPGYDTEDLLTFQIAPDQAQLTDAAAFARFHTDFARRIEALPGVDSVGLVENVPLEEGLRGARVRAEESGDDEDAGTQLEYTWASPRYFETMGIDVLAGRGFTEADHTTDLTNVIVSRAAADRLWPGQEAVGRRLLPEGSESWRTVVGVVENTLQYSFRDTPPAILYLPLVGPGENPAVLASPGYVVRSRRAADLAPEIRALVQEVAPEAPMYRVHTMADLAADSMTQLSFTLITLAVAAGLALLLGALGLYGVLATVVAERTREIGVRMAMGAAPGRVQWMVVRQGFRVVSVGIVLGLLAAVAITRLLGGLLYGIEAVDPATFAWMSVAMGLLGVLAAWAPARRASTVDPMESLRAD